MTDIAAIVLAAGQSKRFTAATDSVPTKLIADLDGKPLVRYAADAVLASRARPVIVVTGHAEAEVEAALSGLALTLVHNENFATGLSSSLKAGIAALPAGVSGAVILLGDMPRVSASLIDSLCDAFEAQPQASAIVPVHAGEKGNPVLVSRALFGAIASLSGDQGARKIIEAAGADVVELTVSDDAVRVDVDTPALLAAIRTR